MQFLLLALRGPVLSPKLVGQEVLVVEFLGYIRRQNLFFGRAWLLLVGGGGARGGQEAPYSTSSSWRRGGAIRGTAQEQRGGQK